MSIEEKGQRRMKKRNLLHIATSLLIAALVVAACNKKIEPPDAETSEVIEMTTETSAMHEIETEVTTEVTTVETTEETTEKMEEETSRHSEMNCL